MLPSGNTTPLRPSDFSFYGFDHLLPQLEDTLRQLGIRHGEPQAPVVEDAIFVPPRAMERRGQFEGALLNRDGTPIPTAQSQRRFGAFGEQVLGTLSAPVDLKPERVVDEEVVYLGWHINHFGHILLESLARVWILEQLDPAIKVVFHIQDSQDLSGATLPILEAFGVPLDRILVLDQQTVLRRVIVPEALYEIAHAAHERMALPFHRVAASIVGDPDPSNQPVYLSRRLLPSTQRQIVGEFEMEEVLRENGFLIVHPETMAFEDQVRIVNQHRDIFASTGSAAYASLFCLRPFRLHILTSGIPIPDYFLVPKAAGAETCYSNCLSGGEEPLLDWYMPPLVNMDKLADYLSSLGLLRTRLRASLVARSPVLASRHEDARLYTQVRYSETRGPLPREVEAAALLRARSSWPLSWILAINYARQDPTRTDALVQQFIDLLAAESDTHQLAYFHKYISNQALKVANHCAPETATRLTEILLDRLAIDLERKRAERRLARQEARRIQSEAVAERAPSR